MLMKFNLTPHRNHLIKSDFGTDDYYKYYKKFRGTLDRRTYSKILRDFNTEVHDLIISSNYIYKLPARMGTISVIKKQNFVKFEDGKIKTNLKPDWNATMKLWEDNPEARKNKVLVRCENKHSKGYFYKLKYTKTQAKFTYKNYYFIKFNRGLKNKLSKAIKEDSFDCFMVNKYIY